MNRRHCRFCSGQRLVNHGDGVLVPCGACQYENRQTRQTGARVGNIAAVAVFSADQHGDYFTHMEYEISFGDFSTVTRDKHAAPRIYKQYLELSQ